MAEKKSLLSKVRAAVKKVTAKPQVKKAAAKLKVTAKPQVKKAAAKLKVTAKPQVKKAAAKLKVTAKPQVKKAAAKLKVTAKPQVKKAAAKSVSGLKQFKSYTSKANEKYMSKSQITHFKKILNDWKIELSSELSRTVSHMQTDVTTYADPNDRASQESEMALELRNRDRERKLIKKINETLKNIDEDEYGYCMGCGEEIGLNRLQARPTATLCIDCKTLQEIKEKQMAK
jgi:DnaK suppressor protein